MSTRYPLVVPPEYYYRVIYMLDCGRFLLFSTDAVKTNPSVTEIWLRVFDNMCVYDYYDNEIKEHGSIIEWMLHFVYTLIKNDDQSDLHDDFLRRNAYIDDYEAHMECDDVRDIPVISEKDVRESILAVSAQS